MKFKNISWENNNKERLLWHDICIVPDQQALRGEDCVLFIFVSAESVIALGTKQLFRICEWKGEWRSVPFSLSIPRWSRLLVCEIERSYQCTSQKILPCFDYLLYFKLTYLLKSRIAGTGFRFWKCRLGSEKCLEEIWEG